MVIYRKYRPQTFKEVIGQDKIVQIIENEIKQDKIAHAYLFTGPRGLGKTTLSRLLAKSVNCLKRKKGESEACNTCIHCKDIIKGRFMDLIELDAASQTGVDNVRENIIGYCRIPPTMGKYKVFIIDEVHMLSTAAFNALLKILEEPPEYVIFILATTEAHKLPDTIISRCQRFDLTKVGPDEIVKRLKMIIKKEKMIIPEEVLKTIAVRSEGCVRDSESLLSQVMALDKKKVTISEAELVIPPTQNNLVIELTELLVKKDAKQSIEMVNGLLDKGLDLEYFTTDLIDFIRKLLLIKIGALSDNIKWHFSKTGRIKMEKLSKEADLNWLAKTISELVRTKTQFGYSQIPQLPLELAILKVCEQKE